MLHDTQNRCTAQSRTACTNPLHTTKSEINGLTQQKITGLKASQQQVHLKQQKHTGKAVPRQTDKLCHQRQYWGRRI